MESGWKVSSKMENLWASDSNAERMGCLAEGMGHVAQCMAQGAEGQLLGPLPIDHVQDHRDHGGEACQQESNGAEGHGMFRLVMYRESMKS